MTDIQTEKAFQKQGGLNLYNKYLLYGEEQPKRKTVRKKKGVKVKKTGKRMKAVRYFKKVGLGFKTPLLGDTELATHQMQYKVII